MYVNENLYITYDSNVLKIEHNNRKSEETTTQPKDQKPGVFIWTATSFSHVCLNSQEIQKSIVDHTV